ncbi:MAG: RDD family protein [Candidatus Dormibacteria bacterium]
MASTTQYDGLFIATPERVSLAYQLAGLGSRSVAQLLDVLLLTVVLVAFFLGVVAAQLGSLLGNLLMVVLVFAITNGYFLFFEGLWSGQTPGKRALRLRVVGEAGQPITFEQSLTRNLVRNLDFIPFGYGIGLIALFANGRGKRLGDLAAGTVVVRERPGLSLGSLVAMSHRALTAEATAQVAEVGVTGEPAYARQRTVRDLEPALRDFVVAYASRRPTLAMPYRVALAESARASLEKALPALAAEHGPLAALDALADYAAGVTRPVGP